MFITSYTDKQNRNWSVVTNIYSDKDENEFFVRRIEIEQDEPEYDDDDDPPYTFIEIAGEDLLNYIRPEKQSLTNEEGYRNVPMFGLTAEQVAASSKFADNNFYYFVPKDILTNTTDKELLDYIEFE